VTGVFEIKSGVVGDLIRVIQTVELMGARSVLTGISTPNALTLLHLEINLEAVTTSADLQQGIPVADQLLFNSRPSPTVPPGPA
jgi:rsbT co-antagonist protein RsbR